MVISKIQIYGLNESIQASGYPMQTQIHPETIGVQDKDINRCKKLGNAEIGSGHDCFLKGIVAEFDLTLSRHTWLEALRYHFLDVISSESTMHMMAKMNITFSEYTSQKVINDFKDICNEYIKNPTRDNWLAMMYSYPSGLLLTARMVTNYLQLKTIYNQRLHHRIPEWTEFCNTVKDFPMFSTLCLKEDK